MGSLAPTGRAPIVLSEMFLFSGSTPRSLLLRRGPILKVSIPASPEFLSGAGSIASGFSWERSGAAALDDAIPVA